MSINLNKHYFSQKYKSKTNKLFTLLFLLLFFIGHNGFASETMNYREFYDFAQLEDRVNILLGKVLPEKDFFSIQINLKAMTINDPDKIKLYIDSKKGKISLEVTKDGVLKLPISAKLYEENPMVKKENKLLKILFQFYANIKGAPKMSKKGTEPGFCGFPASLRLLEKKIKFLQILH